MKFYRYEYITLAVHYENGELSKTKYPIPKLRVIEFDLVSETPKGYWIGNRLFPKWIPKANAKYAHTTKNAALTALIKRTKNRISILKHQLEESEASLTVAEDLKTKRN